MEAANKTQVTVACTVDANVEKVWKIWAEPNHIKKWNSASDDWHTPRATNDLRTGGKFSSTMAAKDGSFSFDFEGTYDKVEKHKLIEYTMPDGRHVKVTFEAIGGQTRVVETFDAETTNSVEMQRDGWQAILNNFKKYTEAEA